MVQDVRVPATVEEVAEAINKALGTHGYWYHFHYERRVGLWAWIEMDQKHIHGDNPVEAKLSIIPEVDLNASFPVLRDLADDYQWVVRNQRGQHEGFFEINYSQGRMVLTTLFITDREGDIQSTYSVERKKAVSKAA